jgi:hypothetical protein
MVKLTALSYHNTYKAQDFIFREFLKNFLFAQCLIYFLGKDAARCGLSKDMWPAIVRNERIWGKGGAAA